MGNNAIQKEEKRIIKFLKNKSIDNDKLNIAMDLIKDIAYMTVKTTGLKEEIDTNGIIEEYKNGDNQYGRKKSAAVDVYLNMTKQKSTLIKQLTDLLPVETAVETVKDEFDDFLNVRKIKNLKRC